MIIIATIIGVILGTVLTVIIGITTFKDRLTSPYSGNISHYISIPYDLYQARKGDMMYLRTEKDTMHIEFYHTNFNTNQDNVDNVRILADSMFYLCPPIIEELNIH